MARKIKEIKKYDFKDKQALEGLAKTGVMEKQDLLKFITNNRVETYLHEKNDLIKECYCNQHKTTYYKLTETGKELVKEKYGITPYKFNSYNHDRIMRDDYMKMSQSEQLRTLSEPDFRAFVKESILQDKHSVDDEKRYRAIELEQGMKEGKYSLPDLATVRDEDFREGMMVSISDLTLYESVSENYKQYQIDSKNAFAQATSCSMQMTYTYK